MSKLETIEVPKFALCRGKKQKRYRTGSPEYLEDRAELNPQFVQSIERGQADLRGGRVRVHRSRDEPGH
jgi:hypothetical protein